MVYLSKEFGRHISLVQIEKLSRAMNKCVFSFWTVILITGIIATFYQTFICFTRLNRHETIAAITINYNNTLEFPSVTICSLNPYKNSAMAKNWKTRAFIQVSNNVGSYDKAEKQQTTAVQRHKRATTVPNCLSNYLSSPLSSLRIRLPTYYLGWTGCSPTAFVSYFTAESNKDCIQDKWFLEPFSSSEPNMYMIYNFGHTAAWEVSPSGQIILNTATCTPQQIFTFVDYNSTDCFILNAQTLNIAVTVTRSTLPSGSTTAVCNDTIHLQNKTNKYQPFRIEVATCNGYFQTALNQSVCGNQTFANLLNSFTSTPTQTSTSAVTSTQTTISNNTSVLASTPTTTTSLTDIVSSATVSDKITNKAATSEIKKTSTLITTSLPLLETSQLQLLTTKSNVKSSTTATINLSTASEIINGRDTSLAQTSPTTTTTLQLDNGISQLSSIQQVSYTATDITLNSLTTTVINTELSTSVEEGFSSIVPTENDTSVADLLALTSEELINILQLTSNPDTMSQATTLQEALPYIMISLTESERTSFGYQITDLVYGCRFNNRKCSIYTDFLQWNDIVMGNCFTFNHKNFTQRKFSEKPGLIYGLSILFAVSQADYMKLSNTGGLKMFLGYPKDPFFLDTQSYSISPSQNVQYSLTYREFNRLSTSQVPCTSDNSSENYFYDGRYTIEGCVGTCYQKHMLQKCGCGDPRFPLPNNNGEKTFCEIQHIICARLVSDNFTNMIKNCDCKQSCHDNNYDIVGTTAKEYFAFGKNEHSSKNPNMGINVYFQSFAYLTLTEELSYTVENFFADFGAITGNYLGACVITAFELAVLAMLLVLDCMRKKII